MSLEAILAGILASGEGQVREIEAQAQSRAEDILAVARAEAERLRQEARASVVGQASKESTRLMYEARLEALQIVGNVRDALVDDALQRTRQHLANVRSDPIYPGVMRQLVEEALHVLGESTRTSEQPQLIADPRDRGVVEQILRQMGLELLVSYELSCLGGLVARSEDGRVVAINTLDSRLERAVPHLRRVLTALFEEAPMESSLPVQQT
jgi:vacuolar-type H+-ATPase subunit E/Vma4